MVWLQVEAFYSSAASDGSWDLSQLPSDLPGRNCVKVCGNMPYAPIGAAVEVEGMWKRHPKYGLQIK